MEGRGPEQASPPVSIRPEAPGDHAAVAEMITAAFATMPYSEGTEARIVAALRASGAAVVSLVAVSDGAVVGQVMFSPVETAGRPSAWHALGPVAVAPAQQGRGIGAKLILAGLDRLREIGSLGCVLEGAAGYYGRFGFRPAAALAVPGPAAAYFMVLPFADALPEGPVTFHPAFFGHAAGPAG